MCSYEIYYNMYKIFDLHNDYYLKLVSERNKIKYVDTKSKDAENIVSAVWTSDLSNEESMMVIEQARDFVNQHQNLLLGVEDLHFLSKEKLPQFLAFKPVYAGLTWNTTNCIAGGAHEAGKLTNFGRQVIKQIEQNDIKIDLAHLNEESFMDASKTTTKPLFCSHTAFFGVSPNPRNLKDYQLKMIKDSGGLVGLCLVAHFLNETGTATLDDIVSHIDYFACKFGVDNLAIGTDFYGTKFLPKHAKNYQDLTTKLAGRLSKLGYTEKSIQKIFFENANRFFFA